MTIFAIKIPKSDLLWLLYKLILFLTTGEPPKECETLTYGMPNRSRIDVCDSPYTCQIDLILLPMIPLSEIKAVSLHAFRVDKAVLFLSKSTY